MTDPKRTPQICHFCGQSIKQEKAIQAKTENAWAHFSCWYDGPPGVKDANGETV